MNKNKMENEKIKEDNKKYVNILEFIKTYFRYVYILILIMLLSSFAIRSRYIKLRENIETGIVRVLKEEKSLDEEIFNILEYYDEDKEKNKKYIKDKDEIYIKKGIDKKGFNKGDIYYNEYIKSLVSINILNLLIYTIYIIYFYITKKKTLKHMEDISEILKAYPDKTKLEKIIQYNEGEVYKNKSDINKLVQKYIKTISEEENSRISIEEFISDISHQIRIPISNISIQIYSIKNELTKALEKNIYKNEDIEEIDAYIRKVKNIEEDINKISFLIEELLKMARLDSKSVVFKKEKIYFNDFMKNIIDKFEYMAELGNIEIVLEEDDEAYFKADYNWSMEAVSNILKNAIENTKENKKIHICFKDMGIYSRICIKDEGEGLTKEEIKNIFKRFYKGKNSKETSIGIGLNISKKILEAQGGYISINSKKDVGSEFILNFLK